ncbi:hypothetical protein [Ekhidna sp.]|uniref:hypothetical protein n=1 Tax=Ekhidna sp. TaxID=2608089 RepID=UPI003297D821
MAKKETDKPTAKKSAEKKATKRPTAKAASKKEPPAKMTVSKKPVAKKTAPKSTSSEKAEPIKSSRFSTFFKEFKENVSEGAKALADISSDLLEEVKDKAEDLYGKGAEKFEQASGVVENYVERYKGEQEIKQLTKEKDELCSILGDSIYHEFKKSGTISKRFLTTKKSEELFGSIESVDKRILKLGKELDRRK